jgi:hypothetical protein
MPAFRRRADGLWVPMPPIMGGGVEGMGGGTEGAGTAGTPVGGVLSVQGVVGGQALPTTSATPTAANILDGYLTFAATTAATTLITIPAGRIWVGTIGASCSCAETAAAVNTAVARAVFTTAGAGVTPAAGTYFVVDARAGQNAATGTAGTSSANYGSIPFVVIAPAGNAVTIQVASSNQGSTSVVDASAIGALQ